MDDALAGEAKVVKRPPRFSIEGGAIEAGVGHVRGSELHHLRDVMRLAEGAEVELVDPNGGAYRGRITGVTPREALVSLETRAVKSRSTPLFLAVSIIKEPRMNIIVEKAAELGATALYPLIVERTVTRAPGSERLERWKRIALAAAKQSLAAQIMEIKPACDLAGLLDSVPADMLAVMCRAGAPPLHRLIKGTSPGGVLIVCGPEGDFAPDEIAAACAKGFRLAGLGPNRLRSETAAIAALSIASAVMNDSNAGES